MRKGGRLLAASATLLTAAFVFGQDTPEDTGPQLTSVKGSIMRLEGSRLVVGMQDGGIACFDAFTKKRDYVIPGKNDGPVQDLVLFGKQPWWVVADSTSIRTAPAGGSPVEIDLSNSGLIGPIRRLGVWQQMIVAHADNGCRFIEPMTLRVLTPEQALPSEVASLANQGVLTSYWKDGEGVLVVVRRYASKQEVKPGEVQDVAMLTAWSAEWRSPYRLLGSYTADLVDFAPAPAQMAMSGPSAVLEGTVSTGSVGNIQIGKEGIVALDADEALTIPLYKDNWVTNRITTAVPPRYAQTASYNDANVWWADEGKLMHASLEDGSTEVYLPRKSAQILSVAADEDGVWVLQDDAVRQIKIDEMTPDCGFVRYEASKEDETPGVGGQARLAWVLKQAKAPGGKKISAKNSLSFVLQALKSAGVPAKKIHASMAGESRVVALQYGDVIAEGERAGFYVGNGKMLTLREDGFLTQPLILTPESRIHRFFMSAPKLPPGAHSLPIVDIGPVFPIGVGKPNWSLGHDAYVRINTNSPYDGPYLPSHFRLLAVAEDWVGTPYRWGGSSMSGTDCSGFVMSVFKELGVNLPRHSQTMARAPFGEVVFDELRFGDVLVFPHPKHVAIYIGNGRTVETTKGAVGYSTVYRRRTAYVRRFLFN